MPEFKKLFNNLIKSVEGHKEDPYMDSKGNPTIGTGLNLNDQDVQNLMSARGINPEEVKTGQRKLASEELDDIHNTYVSGREKLVRDKIGGDVYDQLKANQKAALNSMGYQSLNNIGPNLTGYVASDDPIGAIREMILNTNKDGDAGILKRRLEEAEMYGGPLDFASSFKTMTPEEKAMVRDTLNKIQNEHSRTEVMNKYGSYLNDGSQPQQFNKLQQLLKTKIGSNQD